MAAEPKNEKARKTQRLCCIKDTSEKHGSLINELLGNFYRQHNEALHARVEDLQENLHIQQQCILRMHAEIQQLRDERISNDALVLRTQVEYRQNYDRMIALTDAVSQFLERSDTEGKHQMNEALEIAGRQHAVNLTEGFDDPDETESEGYDIEELVELEEQLQNPMWQE